MLSHLRLANVSTTQAKGSLVRDAKDAVVGSALVGQAFAQLGNLNSRPSGASANGYDASASSGSNMGLLNEALATRIKTDADTLRAKNPGAVIPADAVTTSGSGLDPGISPGYAHFQARRIAKARGAPVAAVQAVVDGRLLGFVGQPRVNVLAVNRALDARFPKGG